MYVTRCQKVPPDHCGILMLHLNQNRKTFNRFLTAVENVSVTFSHEYFYSFQLFIDSIPTNSSLEFPGTESRDKAANNIGSSLQKRCSI